MKKISIITSKKYLKSKNYESLIEILKSNDIEYEIVLNGEGEISDDKWNSIVNQIKVYKMDGSEATITNWTQYIVFVFRATRDNGATTEIEVKYIEDGVFSPPKKEEKKLTLL